MIDKKLGLRERKKAEIKKELADQGIQLFLRQGFDKTTIDEIVEPLLVSKRTFFRYFSNKEDILFAWYEELTGEIVRALAERPKQEPPYEAVCKALSTLLTYYDRDPKWARSMMALSRETPSLIGRSFEKRVIWEKALADELIKRLSDPIKTRSLRARVIVGTAMSAFQAGTEAWFQADGKLQLRPLVQKAFTFVEA